MMEALALTLAQSPRLAPLVKLAAALIPPVGKLNKYRNTATIATDIIARRTICKGHPVTIRLATASVCNYRCLFCEIHKDNILFPDRKHNLISLDNVRNYEGFLSTAGRVCFYGGSAEPLLNKDFGNIVVFLKKKFGNELMVNTNGSCLTEKLSALLIQYGFDYILLSYHAGTTETYRHLMTGDISRVDKQMVYLAEQKAKLERKKPIVDLNFALQKLNAGEAKAILDKALLFKAKTVHINRYYGGRNKLQDRHVSFEFDVETGNHALDELYRYARGKTVTLLPEKPPYWEAKSTVTPWNPENVNTTIRCYAPWLSLQMDPVLDEGDCHYASVCNRITLFKVRYQEAKFRTSAEFKKLWNHPVLQYLRETVNTNTPNPMCKYCKNYDRELVRNVDSSQYASIRDQAVVDFFKECQKRGPYPGIPGVEVLNSNPLSEARFQDKLAESGLLNT